MKNSATSSILHHRDGQRHHHAERAQIDVGHGRGDAGQDQQREPDHGVGLDGIDVFESWLSLQVAVDQIEQREQEDPDDIDEVPVEAAHVDRRVVLGAVTSLRTSASSRYSMIPRRSPCAGRAGPVMAK